MSPSSREITGHRPLLPKIHKDSHLIQKPTSAPITTTTTTSSSSSSSSSSASSSSASASSISHRHPVIIYTHSPKIIHTQARDFMSLVQKLTGLSRSADDDGSPALHPHNDENSPATRDRKEESLDSSAEKPATPTTIPVAVTSAAAELEPLFSEIPLFVPGTETEPFCSPGSMIFGYGDQPGISSSMPNVQGSISPPSWSR